MSNPAKDFVNRTGCTLLLYPRDFACGDVFEEASEKDPERLGRLSQVLKPNPNIGPLDMTRFLYDPTPDSQLITNYTDFSSAELSGGLNKAPFAALSGKFQYQDFQSLVYQFLENTMQVLNVLDLNGEMKKYSFDTAKHLFDFDKKKYYIITEVRRSKKFVICTYSATEKGGQLILELMNLFDIKGAAIKSESNMQCAGSPSTDFALAYGVKLAPLTRDYYILPPEEGPGQAEYAKIGGPDHVLTILRG